MQLQTFTSFQFCILLVWSANGDAPFQVNLLNDDTYRWNCATSSIRREVLLRMFEKVSRSLKYDSNIFFVHKHIYNYMDTTTDHFTPLALRVRGNDTHFLLGLLSPYSLLHYFIVMISHYKHYARHRMYKIKQLTTTLYMQS